MAAGTSANTRTVFYCKQSYGYARVCYGLPVPGCRFALRRALPMRRLQPRSAQWRTTRLFLIRPPGIVHTFNDIVRHAQAWIVSHELELPRFLGGADPRHVRDAYERLADDRCRAVLPMSDAARRWLLRRLPEDLRRAITAKTQVFTGGVHGPEHVGLPVRLPTRAPAAPLNLVFVGNSAFRKGGVAALDAFDALRAGGVDCRLTFIGQVPAHSYTGPVTADDHAGLIRRLGATPGVTWHRQIPNRAVLATLAEAHIGLLPTYDDSLGWSVIEMMSTGTPVVASNIVALPELVSDGITGRLIELPCDADGRWIGLTQQADREDVHRAAHDALVAGVVAAVAELSADEDLRQRLGAAGRKVYEANYTPERAGERLREIYDRAWPVAG